MGKHSDESWKEDQVIIQLSHSVDNADEAVGRARTNPTEERMNEAFEKIEKAERSCTNAIQSRGNSKPVLELQARLTESKDKLNQLH
ncbi:hypothetical protein [Jeotgalibacillus salarius]|uniref:DUF2524 family protein n=1 Tax=Jeotgalibacillus salarius TaxID=546023 RepID=A0A4Y8LBQ4_9BACL|nr:hypothetical protein [Jeotgalibacillus salarius]TFD99498.1 hypothetical protein E2626_14665 [Jeotgalibacillus salarius]